MVGTIRRYIGALGRQLRIVADSDDHTEVVSTSQVDRGDLNEHAEAV